MIARLAWALRRTARIACEQPRATVWTVAAMTGVLFAFGLAALAADRVSEWTDTSHGGASMIVYLGEGLDDAHASALATELGSLAGVEHAEFVPAAESARRLELALGADAALLEGIDRASLPASIEATLAPGVADVVAMSPTVQALRSSPGVADVVVEDTGANRVAGALASARAIAWGAAVLLAVVAALVVLAAVRVRLVRSKRECEVLNLLGASPSFTRVPSALAGALHGTLAAVLAAVGVVIVVALYGARVTQALALGDLAVPAIAELVLFVALGALLGATAGMLAGLQRA